MAYQATSALGGFASGFADVFAQQEARKQAQEHDVAKIMLEAAINDPTLAHTDAFESAVSSLGPNFKPVVKMVQESAISKLNSPEHLLLTQGIIPMLRGGGGGGGAPSAPQAPGMAPPGGMQPVNQPAGPQFAGPGAASPAAPQGTAPGMGGMQFENTPDSLSLLRRTGKVRIVDPVTHAVATYDLHDLTERELEANAEMFIHGHGGDFDGSDPAASLRKRALAIRDYKNSHPPDLWPDSIRKFDEKAMMSYMTGQATLGTARQRAFETKTGTEEATPEKPLGTNAAKWGKIRPDGTIDESQPPSAEMGPTEAARQGYQPVNPKDTTWSAWANPFHRPTKVTPAAVRPPSGKTAVGKGTTQATTDDLSAAAARMRDPNAYRTQ